MSLEPGDYKTGRVGWSPDYKGVAGPGPCVKEFPFPGVPDIKHGPGPVLLSLTPEEVAMLGRLRNLRPGQTLTVTRCEHGAAWDTVLTCVEDDPA